MLSLPFPRRRLAQFVRHCTPENDDLIRRSSNNVINVRPEMLLTGSTAFYGAMTLASIALGNISDIKVLDSIKSSLDITGSLTWLTPMIMSLLITVALTDRVPQLKRIRNILETSFFPSLSQLPPWVRLRISMRNEVDPRDQQCWLLEQELVKRLYSELGSSR